MPSAVRWRIEQAEELREEVERYTDAERAILADAYQALLRYGPIPHPASPLMIHQFRDPRAGDAYVLALPRWWTIWRQGEEAHTPPSTQEDHGVNSRRRSYSPMQLLGGRRQQPPAVLLAAVRVGAAAVGAAAVGAGAVGALAVGRLAVGRAVVRRLKIEDLEVTRLHVHDLRIDQQPAAAQPTTPSASPT